MGKIASKNRIIQCCLIVLVAIFLISAALIVVELWDKSHNKFPESSYWGEEVVSYNGKEYVLKDEIETFLVLGLDKFEGDVVSDSYNNDKQSDFLMLFVFDNTSKKSAAIHINRDTMATVNILGVAGEKIGTVTEQIALAHTEGNGKDVSCRNVADSVSSVLLGMRVNHYLSLTLDAVPAFNNLVGGVEVTVLDDFTGIDETLVKGETVTLTGEQALHYVRTRAGLEDSSNATRMVRQRQYIEALHGKTQQIMASDEEFVVKASLEMSKYIISDRSVTQLQELAKKFNEYEFVGINSIEGENKKGEEFMEFYPDEESVKETVIELFYKLKD